MCIRDRYSDTDDVICNAAGALLGAVWARVSSQRNTVLWVIAAVGVVLLTVYAALGLSA